MKTLLLSIIMSITMIGLAFPTKVTVVTSFPDAKIYVDDVYKADGKYEFITELKLFIIRVEKQGYKTEVRRYKYNSLKSSGFLGFERGDPLNVTIILYPENETTTQNSNSNSGDKTQLPTSNETLKTEDAKDYKRLNVTRIIGFNTQAKIFIEPIVADYVLVIPLLKNSLEKQGFVVVDNKSKADYSITIKYKSRNDLGCDGRVISSMQGFVKDLKVNSEAAKFTFGQSKFEGKCTDKVMDSLVHKLKTGED